MCNIKNLQILGHQHIIPTRVDILSVNYYPSPSEKIELDKLAFTKVGHIKFDDNLRSNYGAREMKSVQLNITASYIKFLIQKSYANSLNTFRQASIVNLSFIGEPTTPIPKVINTEQSLMGDSSKSITNLEIMQQVKDQEDKPKMLNREILELCQLKAKAVEMEDYDQAHKIKQIIQKIESNQIRL